MADDVGEEKKDKENLTPPQNTVNNVLNTVKLLLLIENFFGIFRVCVTDNGLAPVSKKMKLTGILVAALTTVIFFFRLDIPKSIIEMQSLVDWVEGVPSLIILIQYIAAVISTLFFLGELTIKILSTFVDLDTTLRINLNETFYSKCRSRTIASLILLVAIHIIFAVADMASDDEFEAFKIISMILYFTQDLEIFAFCKMVVMLKSRLKIVNEYLEQFVHEKDTNKTLIFIVNEKEKASEKQFDFIGRISPNNMKIRDLATTYDTIGNTCYLINNVFKFQIFMNLVSTFVFILITIWTSLYYFRTPGSTYGPLVTALSWCLLTVISVAVMSFTCESVLTARNNTKVLVNEIIMDYDLPRTMRIQAKVFMELIEAWPLRIFVYDMFSVDIKLMLKFVSVATTYLIVVIQISHFI